MKVNRNSFFLIFEYFALNNFPENHTGFGFSCDVSCRKESGEPDGLYVVRQMVKPKRRFQGLEDSPLDIFDVNPSYQRQVLGLVIKKLDTGGKNTVLEVHI